MEIWKFEHKMRYDCACNGDMPQILELNRNYMYLMSRLVVESWLKPHLFNTAYRPR